MKLNLKYNIGQTVVAIENYAMTKPCVMIGTIKRIIIHDPIKNESNNTVTYVVRVKNSYESYERNFTEDDLFLTTEDALNYIKENVEKFIVVQDSYVIRR